MSEEILAPLIAIGILAAMFLWVPTLHLCNDRCQKLLRGRALRKSDEAPALNGKTIRS